MDALIRAAVVEDAAAIARVHVDAWRTTYAGIVPAEYIAGLSYRRREARWREILATARCEESRFVATTAAGEVVGFADGGPELEGDRVYRGELYGIYILEAWQRRGLGRRLVAAVTRRLLADGYKTMLLWSLADNAPARRFYESLGGEVVARAAIVIGGAELEKVAYGWRDVAVLAGDAGP